jgi:hypothetical protein
MTTAGVWLAMAGKCSRLSVDVDEMQVVVELKRAAPCCERWSESRGWWRRGCEAPQRDAASTRTTVTRPIQWGAEAWRAPPERSCWCRCGCYYGRWGELLLVSNADVMSGSSFVVIVGRPKKYLVSGYTGQLVTF